MVVPELFVVGFLVVIVTPPPMLVFVELCVEDGAADAACEACVVGVFVVGAVGKGATTVCVALGVGFVAAGVCVDGLDCVNAMTAPPIASTPTRANPIAANFFLPP